MWLLDQNGKAICSLNADVKIEVEGERLVWRSAAGSHVVGEYVNEDAASAVLVDLGIKLGLLPVPAKADYAYFGEDEQ